MTRKEKVPFHFLMITLTVCCFGCSGGGTDVDLGTVSGVVTMDGKPLQDAIVVFAPAEGNPSSGRTDANGNYELSYLGDAKGALLGSSKVTITTGKPVTAEVDADTDMAAIDSTDLVEEADPALQGDAPKKEAIPAKYNIETTLSADVKAGSNTFDFKLESK